ncbi:MAG: class I SAM-dependent methyltransferase, partial [Crocinitomicaceae bacterium]|nr:class I SAM-dependent methyltransferase [Crocinitomicaceae bacterium]
MQHEDNPKSIKYYVKRWILAKGSWWENKIVIDFPAGNGVTTKLLHEAKAKVVPMDLFPEYYQLSEPTCVRANIREGLPIENAVSDCLVCQEGIEHFSDQFSALQEFNRTLKMGGTLLITTPNYSNLRSRMSYLLMESERFNDIMPPNELDSIWMTNKDLSSEIYFGHIFLTGIQKLRALAKLSGFRIEKIHFTRAKSTSVLLFPFLYPFIYLSNWWTYRKNLKKNELFDEAAKQTTYQEIFKLAVSRKILIGGDLMVEFVKEKNYDDVIHGLRSQHKVFG